ncbi:MAG TPA: hypothetical protein ENI27_07590 [bacterium]|nr:hypothetical protein [bacterium]
MNADAKPGHNIFMAAVEVNRLLNRHREPVLPIMDLEAAITKGLWADGGPPEADKLAQLLVMFPSLMDWCFRSMALLDKRQGEIGKIQSLRKEMNAQDLRWESENNTEN